MKIIEDLAALNRDQRATFIASVLGWTLDAFDYFLMAFAINPIATEFHVPEVDVLFAITLTLMFRPLGALVFGSLADHFGRRLVLMGNVLLFSFFALASAFSPNLTVLLILRALFGFAMGGEWGIGASLVMESIPVESRGTVSGILQQGYPFGFLLASVVYGLFFGMIGWRGMFLMGVLPALLVVYIRLGVKESPVWKQRHRQSERTTVLAAFIRHWKTFLHVILLMAAFNLLSHGTQDVYPTFLKTQHGFSHWTAGAITTVMNIGAIIGGITFGFYSQRIGRRRAIIIAVLLALPVIPLWAFSTTPLWLGLGAFLLQIPVQGAWGVIPVHLNELSPDEIRGTFPGFAYQLGNLLASSCAVLQGEIARTHGGNYGLAMASVAAGAAVLILVITACGKEAKGIAFGHGSRAGVQIG
jgi:SHS family lactate transporter-like MFS transporter